MFVKECHGFDSSKKGRTEADGAEGEVRLHCYPSDAFLTLRASRSQTPLQSCPEMRGESQDVPASNIPWMWATLGKGTERE